MGSHESELNFKAQKTAEKISENIHIVANDPSLAFFRIQEHVRKSMPSILEKRLEVIELQQQLQGNGIWNMEYAVTAVKEIENSENVFKNVQEIIKTAIFLKQQLKYEEVRNKSKQDQSGKSSVYKRFSAHLAIDLPDFSGVGQRMMTTNRDATVANAQSNLCELQRSHTTLH